VKPSGAANPSARAAKLSVAEGNLVGGVGIEHGEHLNDVLTGIVLAHLAGHHVDELLELDGAVAVTVDVLNHGPAQDQGARRRRSLGATPRTTRKPRRHNLVRQTMSETIFLSCSFLTSKTRAHMAALSSAVAPAGTCVQSLSDENQSLVT
jgi:hypothetical protein